MVECEAGCYAVSDYVGKHRGNSREGSYTRIRWEYVGKHRKLVTDDE